MHLCLLTSSYPTHPADLALPFLPQFAAALEQRGCRVTVLAPDRRAVGMRTPVGPRVLWFRWLGGRRPVVSLSPRRPRDAAAALHLLVSALASLSLLHSREPVDHVLCAFAVPAGAVGLLAHRTMGLPYSVWALGSDVHVWGRARPTRSVIAAVLRGAAHRFADAPSLAEEVAALSDRACRFLPSARELPPPVPVSLDPARRNLLFMGRLEPVKGIDILLEAFARVAAAHPELDLHVVGDGSLAPAVGAAAGRLPGRIRSHPPGDAAMVAGYLTGADVLVVPSRSESIPTLLLEAAAAGLPVVASDAGDVPGVVRDLGLGTVVPRGDATALASGIAAWAASPPARLPTSTIARVRATFTPAAAAESFLSVLRGEVPPPLPYRKG